MPVAACLVAILLVSAAQPEDGPPQTSAERAVRAFVRAVALHDAQEFEAAIVPHPRAARLLNREPLTADARGEAERRLQSLQVRLEDDFLLRGEPVAPDAKGEFPVGAVGHAVAAGQGGPMLVTLVRRPEGWKVDVRWFLAMLDAATAPAPPDRDSPEMVIRQFLIAMISLDRDEALARVVPGADPGLLFAESPRQREPSGVLEATAMEMPLVEAAPGEFHRMPSGRVVEGVSAADRKVLVGQFGPVEMPFALRRIDGRWRVEAEPYYVLINR